jgi:hypothetical protein
MFWHTLSDTWPLLYSSTCCKYCRYRQSFVSLMRLLRWPQSNK